jgi:tRNA dimethylallyltransferase
MLGAMTAQEDTRKPALLVAGPTCSGKSALAIALARALGGTVINADSMQVYRELRILTARPTEAEERDIPHALYGVRPAAEPGDAAWWRSQALDAMAKATLPILCGGTGLYFAALVDGLANIPDPGEPARTQARALLLSEGAAALHARLTEADPLTAARLRPTDGQRIARAWEVFVGTGKGLAAWHEGTHQKAAPYRFTAILLDPPRATLRAAIAARFDAMLKAGALDEVRALLAQNLPSTLPAMRAHGVPELSAFCRGEITLAEARTRTCLVTGQYTKRQATWFRHRHIAAPEATHRLNARYDDSTQESQRFLAEILLKILDCA